MAEPARTSRLAAHKHRCPGHAEMLLAVDAELGTVDVELPDVALDALAWRMMPAAPSPRDDLARLAALVGRGNPGRLGAVDRGEFGPVDTGARTPLRVSPAGTLRITDALHGVPAHPFVVACALADAAGRAGIPIGIVGADDILLLAHRHLREPLVIDPAAPECGVVDAHDRAHGRELRWRCSHQTCCTILDAIAEESQLRGDLGCAIRAAELRLDLPFDEQALARRRDEVAHVRARLN